MLIVTLNDGASLDPLALLRFLEPRMAHFMLPRYIRVVAAMPKTPTAKIEKHRLRAAGVTSDTWDRELHGVTVRGGVAQDRRQLSASERLAPDIVTPASVAKHRPCPSP